MKLIVPTLAELQEAQRTGADVWRRSGRQCDDDAAPPATVVQRSLEAAAAHPAHAAWFVPRLFWAEDALAIVGSGRFKTTTDHPDGVEIGYGIGTRHQGHGYATAGVCLMIAEAFTRPTVKTVIAMVRPDNLPSIRVLKKCGFRPDGQVPDPKDGQLLRFRLSRA
jgi:RimJ/RimL family protein N-acetyltransferase